MRIVFAGTAPFAVPSLRGLAAAGHDLGLVITQPDRPGHRLRLTPTAVRAAALEMGLQVFQPERIRAPESLDRIRQEAPELMVVVAYGQIIPRSLLEAPTRGVINVHGSLLPALRGAAPVAHAILSGSPTTGVTIMQMDEQLDHGPILATRELPIEPDDDAISLAERLAGAGADLLVQTLGRLDELRPVEQDHERATLAPKLRREDGELSWDREAVEIDRRVRAFTPWPGVTLPLGGRRVKVLRGRPVAGAGAPGQVLATTEAGVAVATGSGAYLLEEVQAPGGRPLPAHLLAVAGA